MVKMLVLFSQPEDPEAFDDIYFNEHVPKIMKIPGLQKAEFTRLSSSPLLALQGGDFTPPYYLQVDLIFKDAENFQQAMLSPEGQEAVAHVLQFATPIINVMIGETFTLTKDKYSPGNHLRILK
ncbi:EthD family reductase [Paenactinomyces guangxiensis]|uniref:EthD family reductase n=1 Tax=Paenactinomyces guangxiensis TaxID=1490290 RepID=A0A7W1WQH5_9BACL|nr:EthD family reductase [Paenactinomyces guangxiensis]MBA4494214.1 EthD family reductase [Paenactinomyces guangxiensis]MBH8590710.1 EthD family reductase [Paenactinomyces guangxiensis]